MEYCKNEFIEIYDEFSNLEEIGQIFEGYYLGYDATESKYYVIGGQGKPGDELFIIPKKNLKFDPFRKMTDEQINALDSNDALVKADNDYGFNLLELEKMMILELHTSFRFHQDCMSAGYDINKDGHVINWILAKIEDLLISKQN